jgi:two-component system response regulator MprA
MLRAMTKGGKQRAASSARAKKLILVIEDDPELRDSLRRVLTDEGFATLGAENGESALALLRGDPEPDVIVLDLLMPTMNGWDFLERISREPAAAIPVIVVSAASEHIDRERVAASLRKPIDLESLLAAVRRVS